MFIIICKYDATQIFTVNKINNFLNKFKILDFKVFSKVRKVSIISSIFCDLGTAKNNALYFGSFLLDYFQLRMKSNLFSLKIL